MLRAQGDRALITPRHALRRHLAASPLDPVTGFTATAALSRVNLWFPIRGKTHTNILQGDRDFHKAFASQQGLQTFLPAKMGWGSTCN